MIPDICVPDKMDQARLFVYGLLGHDYCREEIKGFNLCQAQIPAV